MAGDGTDRRPVVAAVGQTDGCPVPGIGTAQPLAATASASAISTGRTPTRSPPGRRPMPPRMSCAPSWAPRAPSPAIADRSGLATFIAQFRLPVAELKACYERDRGQIEAGHQIKTAAAELPRPPGDMPGVTRPPT